ncbi:MAG: hypothetical protein B6I24_04970 [Bacteroidetes bacterium 4572_128]|nr:MAG: hypothetical protein B6I24_04970 [Bacteroidetes bacterium 4572_128]
MFKSFSHRQRIGVKTASERGKRVFLKSNNAKEIVFALKNLLKKNKVEIIYKANVKKFIKKENEIIAVKLENKKIFRGKYFVLATGGASYPRTGSTGDGYKLAKDLGHEIISIRPSLVPFEIKEQKKIEILNGLILKNVKLKVLVNNKKELEKFGEMQFYKWGISGAIVLNLSRKIVDFLNGKKKIKISIDLKPALSDEKLTNRLIREFKKFPNLSIEKILRKLIPEKLIKICLQETKISFSKNVKIISNNEKIKIVKFLKNFSLEITKDRGFSEAIITAGGISTKEIYKNNLQSKILKNLFFTGEVIDVDADTGGYNLQWAFSSSYLVAEKLMNNEEMKNF